MSNPMEWCGPWSIFKVGGWERGGVAEECEVHVS
jgi:hypothetical protein